MLRIRRFGENRSGYNAAHLELLFLFCAATPKSVFAKIVPRLERVAVVSTFENHTGDAALAKPVVAEVNDKSQRNIHQLHVGKQLGLVPNHVDLLLVEGLAFDDQATVDKAVDPQLLLESKALVSNRNDNLGLGLMPTNAHFLGKALFVDVLEKPDTEVLLNFDSGLNDFAGKGVRFFKEWVHGEDYTKTAAANAKLGKNRLWRSPRGNSFVKVRSLKDNGAGVVATTVLAKSAYAQHLRSNLTAHGM